MYDPSAAKHHRVQRICTQPHVAVAFAHGEGAARRAGSSVGPYEQARRLVSLLAFATLPSVVVAACLLLHGTVDRSSRVHAFGAALWGVVLFAQVLVRRRVVILLQRHYLGDGCNAEQSRKMARSTLNGWLR